MSAGGVWAWAAVLAVWAVVRDGSGVSGRALHQVDGPVTHRVVAAEGQVAGDGPPMTAQQPPEQPSDTEFELQQLGINDKNAGLNNLQEKDMLESADKQDETSLQEGQIESSNTHEKAPHPEEDKEEEEEGKEELAKLDNQDATKQLEIELKNAIQQHEAARLESELENAKIHQQDETTRLENALVNAKESDEEELDSANRDHERVQLENELESESLPHEDELESAKQQDEKARLEHELESAMQLNGNAQIVNELEKANREQEAAQLENEHENENQPEEKARVENELGDVNKEHETIPLENELESAKQQDEKARLENELESAMQLNGKAQLENEMEDANRKPETAQLESEMESARRQDEKSSEEAESESDTDLDSEVDTFTPEIMEFVRNLVTRVEDLAQKNYNPGESLAQEESDGLENMYPAAEDARSKGVGDMDELSRQSRQSADELASLSKKENRVMIGNQQMRIDKRGRLIYKEAGPSGRVPATNHIQDKDSMGRTVHVSKDHKGSIKARTYA